MTKTNRQTTTGDVNAAGNYDLEEMIAYIRQNHNVAFRIHQHLTQGSYVPHPNVLGWQEIFDVFFKFPRTVEKALEVSILRVYKRGTNIFRTTTKL